MAEDSTAPQADSTAEDGGRTVMSITGKSKLCFLQQIAVSGIAAVLIAGAAQTTVAEAVASPAFDSPQEAVAALFRAVKSDDEASIRQLIGGVASSGDTVQDQSDREQFVRKYSEMHRLVKQQDGATVLYIGAENWPLPVPLVASKGKWRFDVDSGAREVTFRRIGEDETVAMDTCRSIVHERAATPADGSHGYRFRVLRSASGTVVVGYPSEYAVTGIMTFAVTPDGRIYEKDLGSNTAGKAQAIDQYKPDRTWHLTEK